MKGFRFLFGVLRGLGGSGRLTGSGCTYPGTCKAPGSRVMAKNPPWGDFFLSMYGIRLLIGSPFVILNILSKIKLYT